MFWDLQRISDCFNSLLRHSVELQANRGSIINIESVRMNGIGVLFEKRHTEQFLRARDENEHDQSGYYDEPNSALQKSECCDPVASSRR